MRLFIFDGGQVMTRGVRFINAQGEIEMRDMRDPNHCYLIEHPQGRLMWDAGLSDSIAALRTHTRKRGKFRFSVRRTLAEQFAQTGIDPMKVDFLAFSHLQVDHAGNAGLFPQAKVLVHSKEIEMAFGPEAAQWGYVYPDFQSITRQELIELDGDHDVFGDGRVMILAAPGHTPGHQVLLVELESGPLLLSGDLYYAEKDPLDRWMPYWNVDREQTLHTMARLEQIARQKSARWVINHDPHPAIRLPLAPEWVA
jgi:N-acyl homoserine lactone hydrolase